jgi:hypothetical protein
MMLSLPDEWNYTTRGLAAICKEGVDSIGGALREMEREGYIVRNRQRDAQGKITDTEYIIYEKPQKPSITPPYTPKQSTAEPCTGNPYMDNAYTGAPYTEKPAQLSTNRTNTKISSTDLSNIYQSIPLLAVDEPDGLIDGIDAYREIIRGNIEYECLAECGHYRRSELDEFVEIMADAAATVA